VTGPRIIVALDSPTADDALRFVDRITPEQCRLKVGMELFTSAGPAFVAGLVDREYDVFLDLKFHDIPNTVAQACSQAARLGVWMLNVHTLGGRSMLEAAREAVERAPRQPLLVGVTLLTSHTTTEMTEIGVIGGVQQQVQRLAFLAQQARLDGVVCSPLEAAELRRQFGEKFVLVTPGIRPEGSPSQDQRRTMTPAEAIAHGADYLVIGRPIIHAPDPEGALREISRQMAVS
jgi:orotidine-5'-phosphate decarboxylase